MPSPAASPLVTLAAHGGPGNGGASPEFDRWAQHNLQPQRQAGYGLVWIKLPAGNISADQFRGSAKLLETYKLGVARIAILQDLVIPWTPFWRAKEIYLGLAALGLATPGATTCNPGITRSLTLADVLASEFADESDPEVLKVRIKISGCPNSCGQHPIADIGLYGNARKIGDHQAPYNQLMLAGEVSGNGVRFARHVVPIAAKRIPQALRAWLDVYLRKREVNESFRAWALRTPDSAIIDHLQ